MTGGATLGIRMSFEIHPMSALKVRWDLLMLSMYSCAAID